MENNIWLFATAGGALILGLAIAYGIMARRRLSGVEKAMQKRRVEELYDKR
ncbi:hypothetical protein [Rhizobium sp. CC-YZS058]|uniref:hypothetical protein n=1 Tax=Rhizobium sp. CC-YZS058 TaxID=3042153 RepID=UPI002B05B55B|nr:hypothetical protein [Rhizobium sp. CC-YZS058]MEA3536325.1 hypothetical protein [Rhizobium sp. CC-YZS058]